MTSLPVDEVVTDVVLELRGITKSFGGPGAPKVLDDLDLTVERGEIVAIAGRSGSGKTTLLTIITGWEQPDEGSVRLLEERSPLDAGWADLAILPQSLGLLDELTVAENIGLPLRLAAVDDPAAPAELMASLGIDHLADRFPAEVSLGEQQRTALARAAVVRPRVLLADEPISHQNEAWAEGMMTTIERLAARGTTCVLATHNQIAFASAQHVFELRAGRLHRLDG